MEYLDVVDEKGEPTGETIERTVAHRKGIRHRTSHVWIFRRYKGQVQVLLQKRSAEKDSYPGCYDISSAGHIPAGCGFEESALRELEEELGIKADKSEIIYCGRRTFHYENEFHGLPFIDEQISNVYMLWRDIDLETLHLQAEEVSGVIWMDFHQCINGVLHNTFPNCIRMEELKILERSL